MAADGGRTEKVGVVGLGYVGLPLATALGAVFDTVGFDIDPARVAEIKGGADSTREVEPEELRAATRLAVTTDPAALGDCSFVIVTVPTPIDDARQPDLGPLRAASETVGVSLNPGDVVVYESTVYPGLTEEVCVPILERASGLTFNRDFHVGYSPERINPGDRTHRLADIVKVVAGSTPETTTRVQAVYDRIVKAGTFAAESIKVAEAAKVIENTQRDLNIALMNELSLIFSRMGIDTQAVLEAAGTKWNFMPFRPGLVGGHCIGVDPYYLTHKAEALGYSPQIILAGRRLNDGMGAHAAERLIKTMAKKGIGILDARILILGLTFKENTPDLRNTRVIDVIGHLEEYGCQADIADPLADPGEVVAMFGRAPVTAPDRAHYDAVILAVPHAEYVQAGSHTLRRFGKPLHVFFDLKSVFPAGDSDLRL